LIRLRALEEEYSRKGAIFPPFVFRGGVADLEPSLVCAVQAALDFGTALGVRRAIEVLRSEERPGGGA
jgi:hypothetical protein